MEVFYRNCLPDLLSKSTDWFLDDAGGLHDFCGIAKQCEKI